jgi:hypothetical protein
MERPVRENNPQKSLGIRVRGLWAVGHVERSGSVEVCPRRVRVDPDKTNDDHEEKNQHLDCAKYVVDDDAPFSRDGMEQKAEGVCRNGHSDDLSRRQLGVGVGGLETILGEGDGVVRRVLEDYEADAEQTCGEKKGCLEHVVELLPETCQQSHSHSSRASETHVIQSIAASWC